MNISDLAIKRPVFITCLFFLIIVVGIVSVGKLGVDLFPNVNFPIIVVTTPYPGAGPAEVESLIAKPIEDALGTISGIKTIRSTSKEGVAIVVVEFTLDTDSKYAEQQVKDRVTSAKGNLPNDVLESDVRTFDPADMPNVTLALTANMGPADLFDLADQRVKPLIEQVSGVGLVQIIGGRKREIHVLLDREKLKARNISASMVASALKISGKNIPAGKANSENKESVVRTLGEYDSLDNVRNTIVSFYGNEVSTRVSDVGTVVETLEDETSRSFIDGKPALTLAVLKRSGTNTMAVVEAIKKKLQRTNADFNKIYDSFELSIVQEQGKAIRANVADVTESIALGIILTIIVVFFFLGSVRSTFITGIALPNSLLGAFILMAVAGFTINIMTLLALSLAVGLLIDDAIVVRENIFRMIEEGASPVEAASKGTKEVTLAVIATSLTVIAVFGPVAFLQGVVGQFFKEFGLTICFAMIISLLDALTMAPMLSAYFAGAMKHGTKTGFARLVELIILPFNKFQDALESLYSVVLKAALRFPILTLLAALCIFLGSFFALSRVSKTFIPPNDTGEYAIKLQLPAEDDLQKTSQVTEKITAKITANNPEVAHTLVTVGGRNGETNEGDIFVILKDSHDRNLNTSQVKENMRKQLQEFAFANPRIVDRGGPGGGQQPVIVNITGNDMDLIKKTARGLFAKIKNNPNLRDVDITDKEGKPEYRIIPDRRKAEKFGISTSGIGVELRTQMEGDKAATFKRNALEYNIRVRLKEDQKNIKENYDSNFVPNMNGRLIKLSEVTTVKQTMGDASIERENKSRYIQITAGLSAEGKGLDQAMKDIANVFINKEIELPAGVAYTFVGQAENFQEMMTNMQLAAMLAILFIYLVLASLYESFIIPLSIMLVLPLAICGAFYSLYITNTTLDIFSMIGCIMLLGIATKNSILLVDYIIQMSAKGKNLKDSIIEAGRVRLRPIFMTTLALISGMLPVAIGLNEASKQRTSMGIAVIGGLISSTLLTLLVVPAAYSYLERFRRFINKIFAKISTHSENPKES